MTLRLCDLLCRLRPQTSKGLAMRKIIERLIYDTDTADHLCDLRCPFNYGDFKWEDTAVYRTPRGRFFLSGEGGAMSRWSESCVRHMQNSWGPGRGIRPITEDEARTYCESALSVEAYEKVFGAAEAA